MITSDQAKTALYIGGGILAAYLAFSIYRKVSAVGETAGNISESVAGAFRETVKELSELATSVPDYIAREADNFTQSAKRVVGMESTAGGSTAEWKAPNYVTQLSTGQFDTATKQFIKAIAKSRGEYTSGFFGFDYSGWKVYSDGTVIDPHGNYYQMDYTGTAMDSSYGFSATGIYTASDSPFKAISYNIADTTPDVFKLPSGLEQF